jgi:ABC-type uncharacterized transport system involved in gliding motility auxiliary subunit
MSARAQQQLNASSLLLILLGFIAAVIVSNQLFKGWRIDLTENSLYTLSDGTKRILENIDEPINLYFYYSDEATAAIPSLRSYAGRVREMLEEFEDEADGMLRLSVIDPLPFSEDEDRASQFGLQGVQLGATPDPIYLGLAGTDSVNNEEVIGFFQPDKESFLEYDIAKLVSTLANPERSVIGLISGVDMAGSFNPQTQGMTPPWVIYEQAQQIFEVRNLGASIEEIAPDVTLLWIVQPKSLPNSTLYAIDQFVLRGGNVLVFVDPVADLDPAQTEGMPQGMPPMGQGSDLPTLFNAWGIEFAADQVVADAQLALPITTRGSQRPIRHYGYLAVGPGRMSTDDVITTDLNVVNLATAGHIRPVADAGFEPLLTSSSNSAEMPASRFSFLPDPSILQNGFSPSGEEFVLAARVTGTLNSAFPNGRPSMTVSSAPNQDTAENSDGHLTVSAEPANIIVVADVDMLGNQMWVQVQNFFGQQLANAFASNGAFVINALENLSGSSDLIAVRSRASFTRPFTRVDQLRATAEAEYRETEQRLQTELADTERRLVELQSTREDSGNLLLSDEQQSEIDRFIDQRATIRKELRAVQRNLDQDIERLGTRLKIINIGLVPLLLTVFLIVAAWRRSRSESK